jgi:diaminopimelate epimerase
MTPRPRSDELVLTKLHGLGNDFLVILDDARAPNSGLSDQLGADVARRLCDRRRGIGADGLVFGRLLNGSGPSQGNASLLGFELWNADGSVAEMSGNGIRCLAHAALDAGWIAEDQDVGVITPAGRRELTIRRGTAPGLAWATVDMGTLKIRGEQQRCNVGHGQLLVDVGNPHLVVLGPDPSTVDVANLGPLLEATDPAGLNVEFVALGPGPDHVTMRVWERGVGETEACGTGACAAAAALFHWRRVGPTVTVSQPGGSTAVEIRPGWTATLSGPSQHVAVCTVRL